MNQVKLSLPHMQMLKEMAKIHRSSTEEFLEELIAYNYSKRKKNVFR